MRFTGRYMGFDVKNGNFSKKVHFSWFLHVFSGFSSICRYIPIIARKMQNSLIFPLFRDFSKIWANRVLYNTATQKVFWTGFPTNVYCFSAKNARFWIWCKSGFLRGIYRQIERWTVKLAPEGPKGPCTHIYTRKTGFRERGPFRGPFLKPFFLFF